MTDSKSLVNFPPEWNKERKDFLLTIQKGASSLGIFFAIVEATNIFLIENQQDNVLTRWFGIISIVVTLVNILTLVWSLRQSKKIRQSEDDQADSTDNDFTRFLLVVQLIVFELFALYFVLYRFAPEDLTNQYAATNTNAKDQQTFSAYLQGKKIWIDILSIANLVIGIYSILTAYSLSSSAITHRLQVFLLGLILLYISFHTIYQVQVVNTIFTAAKFTPTNWSLQILTGAGISTIVFLVFTYLANIRRNRVAYMILGVYFLILIAIIIPATGQVFRDYKSLGKSYNKNCVPELGKLDHTFVEANQCPAKYVYTQTSSKDSCKITTSSNPCFSNPPPCSQSDLQTVWEPSLFGTGNSPSQINSLACINKSCCGALVNIYDRPILTLAALAFTFVIYAYYLAVFTFQLSAKSTGDKQLHRTQQICLSIFFLVLLIVGLIFVAVNKNGSALARQPTVGGFELLDNSNLRSLSTSRKFISSLDSDTLDETTSGLAVQPQLNDYGYANTPNFCLSSSNFFTEASSPANSATSSVYGTLFQSVVTNQATNPPTAGTTTILKTITDLTNLNSLLSSTTSTGTQAYPGFVYLIQANPQASQTCSANIHWTFDSNTDKNKLRILSGAAISTFVTPTAATSLFTAGNTAGAPINQYFGVIGTQQAISNAFIDATNPISVCGLYQETSVAAGATPLINACKTTFTVRVFSVDLVTYGFTAPAATTPATSATEIFSHQHKLRSPRVLSTKHTEEKHHKKHDQFEHLSPALPATTLATNSQTLSIQVRNLIDNTPISGASVTVYLDVANTLKSFFVSGTAGPIQINSPTWPRAVTIDCGQADLLKAFVYTDLTATSADDGTVNYDLLFPADTAPNTAAVLTTYYNIYAIVKAPGYTTNCRAIQVTKRTDLANYAPWDISVGPKLAPGTARVVFEWDAYQLSLTNNAATKDPNSVTPNLFVTFGKYAPTTATDNFDCHVGFTQETCGGLTFHGFNDTDATPGPSSSSSVEFSTIGGYNYLVFVQKNLQTYYQNLAGGIQSTLYGNTWQWISQVKSSDQLFLKYYTADSDSPVYIEQILGAGTETVAAPSATTTGVSLTAFATAAPATGATSGNPASIDSASKVAFLGFCIGAQTTTTIADPTQTNLYVQPILTKTTIWSDFSSTAAISTGTWSDSGYNSYPSTNSIWTAQGGTAGTTPNICASTF